MSFLWGFLSGLALALVLVLIGSRFDRHRAEADRIRDRMLSLPPPPPPPPPPLRVDGRSATWLGRKSSARPRNLPGGPVQTGPGTWTWR
jgi:hypothetical protein